MYKTGFCKKLCSLILVFAIIITACTAAAFTTVSAEGGTQAAEYFAISTDKAAYKVDDAMGYEPNQTATVTVKLFKGNGTPAQESDGYYILYGIRSDKKDAEIDGIQNGESKLYTGEFTFTVQKPTAGYVFLTMKLYKDAGCKVPANNVISQSSIGFGTDTLSQSEATDFDLTDFLTQNVINKLGLDEKQPQREVTLTDIVKELKTADEVKYGRFVFKNDDTDLSDGMVSTFTDYKIENGAPTTESDEYVAAYEKYWLEQTREPGITVICKPIPQQELDNFGLVGSQALNDFDIYDIKVETAASKNTDGSGFTRPLSGTFTVPKDVTLSSCRMYVSFGGYGTYISYPTCYLGAKDACILSVNNHGIPNELKTAAARLMSGDDIDANDGIDTIGIGCDSVKKLEDSIERNKTVETSFYMQTVLRAGRALQFIESLAEWDGMNMTVNGGSYGGYQSIVAAALDGLRGDNAIVGWCDPSVPWMCEPGSENDGYLGSSFRPGVWVGTDSVLPTYFNAVNYGKLIRCVTTIHAGLGDDVCPPAGINILYNVMKNTCADVSVDFTQERLHSESPDLTLSGRNGITYVYKNEKAASPSADKNGYLIKDVITYNRDGTVQMVQKNVLTAYMGTDTALVIPEKVTAIADNAFLNNEAIGSITFASDTNCVKIGNSAFKGCTGLTEVKLPSSIKQIGSNAFDGCAALKTLCGMPNGGGNAFGENLVSIGQSAFNDCRSLRDVLNIPSGISTVRGFCFYNCNSIGGVTLAEGVKTIEAAAFALCNVSEIIIPQSCTSVAHAAFQDSYALDQKTIRRIFIKGNTSIAYTAGADNDAFKGIDTSKVKIYGLANSSAKAYADKCGAKFVTLGALSEYEPLAAASPMGDFTFEGSTITGYNGSDETVVTPYSYGNGTLKFSLSSVREKSLAKKPAMKKLVFSEGITKINDQTFADCNKLVSVTYPQTLNEDGIGAWNDNLFSLKEVTVLSKTAIIPENWFGVGTNYEAITFYGYTGSTLEAWCQKNHYTFSALDQPSVIKPAEDDAAEFVTDNGYITEYRGNNTTVVTPSAVGTYYNGTEYITTTEQRVTGIKDYISGISGVKTLIVSEGITTIQDGAFKNKCQSLETLVLPSTVTNVGAWHEKLSHIKSITVLNPDVTIDINWLGSPTDTNNTTDFDNLVCYGVLNADGSSTLKTWCKKINEKYGKHITFVACDKNGTISTDSGIENGKIVLKAANGNKIVNGSTVYGGASVTVTVQPADGYKLVPNSIKIKGFSYGEYSDLPINVANAADPTGNTFTVKLPSTLISEDMPENGELVVTAKFELITSASASMLGVQTRVRTASNGDPIYDMRFIARLNVVGKTFNIDGKNASVISCGMLAAEEALLGTNADALLRLNSTSPASADFDAVSDNVRLSVARTYCNAPENGTYLDISLNYYDLSNTADKSGNRLYERPISARAFIQYKTEEGKYGFIYSDIITRTGKNAVSNVR